MFKKFFLVFLFLIGLLFPIFFSPSPVFAQDNNNIETGYEEESLEGRVLQILEEKEIIPAGSEGSQLYQKLEILVTKGSLKDQKIIVESGGLSMTNLPKYKVGDKLIISYGKDSDGNDLFYIADYIRRGSLVWLFAIFMALVIVISQWQGATSLLGMGFSFLVIFKFILPKILEGGNPVEIAILGSFFIIPVTFFLSHGVNKKTLIAIVGTVLALIITGVLANIFVDISKLTGFASEEALFLQAYTPGLINIKGLLLAGIIIGVLGVLDDITISQSAIVEQLKITNPKLKAKELFQKAMSVGKDHIASMVNTLVLVYTGASLPLLLIFINNPHSFFEVINYEIIADEIVRTLVGSIGLILAVPITTFIAAVASKKK